VRRRSFALIFVYDETIALLKSLGAEASATPRTDIAASPDSRVN